MAAVLYIEPRSISTKASRGEISRDEYLEKKRDLT
jgi:hypothetical protein